MPLSTSGSVTPAVVAQRLCDLLQCFPSASMGGVRWRVLVKKYEERYNSRVDLRALGHKSALSAATALLWDVLRIVDSEDTENPVVGLEDALALTARPGFLATWPSLYRTLGDLVKANGTPDGDDLSQSVLLSQLKPLLLKHWHANFDEGGMIFFADEGGAVKLKKMKHLVQAVLRWREQRVAWQRQSGHRCSSVDVALEMQMELVPSKRHNDLLLRSVNTATSSAVDWPCRSCHVGTASTENRESLHDAPSVTSFGSTVDVPCSPNQVTSSHLEQEIAALRAENEHLRNRHSLLELFSTPVKPVIDFGVESIDDPFEPPPERLSGFWDLQTGTPGTGSMTPMSEMSGSWHAMASSGSATPIGSNPLAQLPSGAATPMGLHTSAQAAGFNVLGQACALVPMWASMGDHMRIPQGAVQQARAFWQRGDQGVLPSFFATK